MGRRFEFAVNSSLATKGVRGSAKYEGSQEAVWKAVSAQKDTATKEDLAKNTNSSANELFDSPQVRKLSDEYGSAFAKQLREHSDAVGVVVVINGQIEEVNLYPNHALLSKFLPRLAQSYALQTAMLKEQAVGAPALTSAQVAEFLKETKGKSPETRSIDGRNVAVTQELVGDKFQCATKYDGKIVHWQMMKKTAASETAKPADKPGRLEKLGSRW
jgi:hypothetical protein